MITGNWRTASYTGGQGNCVETGSIAGSVLIRDTKDRGGLVLPVPPAAWRTFIREVKQRQL